MLAIHQKQLAEHGGLPGLRNEGGLESCISKPVNLALYEPNLDVSDLAAAYAIGFGQRQSFIDGNKRVSAVVTELFLNLNGLDLIASDSEIVSTGDRWRQTKLPNDKWLLTDILLDVVDVGCRRQSAHGDGTCRFAY